MYKTSLQPSIMFHNQHLSLRSLNSFYSKDPLYETNYFKWAVINLQMKDFNVQNQWWRFTVYLVQSCFSNTFEHHSNPRSALTSNDWIQDTRLYELTVTQTCIDIGCSQFGQRNTTSYVSHLVGQSWNKWRCSLLSLFSLFSGTWLSHK